MTIHTGFFNEKKPINLVSAPADVETGAETAFAPLRPSTVPHDGRNGKKCIKLTAYLCLLMLSCAAALLCLQLIQLQTERPMTYHGALDIPYESNYEALSRMNERLDEDPMLLFNGQPLKNMLQNNHFFREEFELDLEDDSYSKVTVPEFRDGRQGRFLHDFKFNQSLIMDKDNMRCFVMTLDRETVLQPRSMYDLFNKMISGYYNIDTQVVRKNMRVVVPPLSDLSVVAPRIANECYGMKIFQLEKFQSGVFKRSITELGENAKFGGFAGKHIVEFNLVNIDEATKY